MIEPARGLRLQPERELFLLCARTELDGAARRRMQDLIDGPLDWPTVLRYSNSHGTLPLLFHHLTRLLADRECQVADSVLDELRRRALGRTARALMLVTELKSLLASMEAGGAPAVAWKGPVLAYAVYPSPELRTFVDLDLLVRRRDLARARAVLQARGYVVARSGGPLDEDELFDREDHAICLIKEGTRILVDLHWGALVRYFSSAMDVDALCEQVEPLTMDDATITALAPEPLLLVMSVHGAKHGPFPWPKLKWVTDVEAFLRAYPESRWDSLLARARASGTQRMLLLGICLARDLLDAPVPAAVQAAIRGDAVVMSLVPGIRTRLLSDDPASLTFGDRLRFDLAVRERLRDRVRYLSLRLITSSPRDLPDSRLPAALGFLRVPVRLARLATKYSRPSRLRELFLGTTESR